MENEKVNRNLCIFRKFSFYREKFFILPLQNIINIKICQKLFLILLLKFSTVKGFAMKFPLHFFYRLCSTCTDRIVVIHKTMIGNKAKNVFPTSWESLWNLSKVLFLSGEVKLLTLTNAARLANENWNLFFRHRQKAPRIY